MAGYYSNETVGTTNRWQNLLCNVSDKLDSFFASFTKEVALTLRVPTNVYLRTELICTYVEEKINVSFNLAEFIMLLYIDFLETNMTTYEPKRVYEAITRSYGYEEVLILRVKDNTYEFPKRPQNITTMCITIDKKDAKKGQLLLEEIEDLYGQVPTLEKMLTQIWINFIEEYKAGNNQKALYDIIRLLEKNKQQL